MTEIKIKAKSVQPILVIDLEKLSVAELIKLIEARDPKARWTMLVIQAAIARATTPQTMRRLRD